MLEIPLYPKMDLSGLHCDFAALSRFHRQGEQVHFDKAVNALFFYGLEVCPHESFGGHS